MMTWLSIILDVLFKPKESASFFITHLIGYLSLIVGGVLGFYFFFQLLVPLIGYLETGALFCAFFFITGGLFLILGRKKPTSPLNDLMYEAQKMIKETKIDKTLKENAPKILLYSLAASLILSQLKDLTNQFRHK